MLKHQPCRVEIGWPTVSGRFSRQLYVRHSGSNGEISGAFKYFMNKYGTCSIFSRLLSESLERLWRTVKYEEVYLKDYETPREAMQGLAAFFVRYNERRQHQALGYQTPAVVYFGSYV